MVTLNPVPQQDFSDVLLVPRVNTTSIASRAQVALNRANTTVVPIIVANMDSIGTFEVASIVQPYGLMVALLKDHTVKDWEKNVEQRKLNPAHLIPTMGTSNLAHEIDKVRQLQNLFPTLPFVCLDVANGYLQQVSDAIKKIKDAVPNLKICAGNVVDAHGVEHLAQAGASIIKIGIGSGGVCLTRQKTGVGFPQFSALLNVQAAARQANVEIISDGGITCPGDVAKAFAASADYVMAGSYFAGHEETGQVFHGMSSDRSRAHRGEAVQDYRATEGREVFLQSKGSLGHTLRDLLGGLRSSCTYLGVSSLEELKNAPLHAIVVNRQLNKIAGVSSEN